MDKVAPDPGCGELVVCSTRLASECANYTMNGTPVASQVPGDCHSNQCNGSGGVVTNIDNSDVPVDGNQCTLDLCMNGVPANPPAMIGTPCNQMAGVVCNGASACVSCNVGADRPGQDTDCQVRTCTMNMCGLSFKPNGTHTSMQVPGDCHSNQCDGAGGIASRVDDTDVPAVAQGGACNQNGGVVCDGNSACVQCNAGTDCPGQDTECKARTCGNHACGFGNTPNGFVLNIAGVDRLYGSDDRAVAATGGIQKWQFDGAKWNLIGVYNTGLTAGTRGLTALQSGNSITILATSADGSPNKLVTVTDDGSTPPANVSPAVIATAAANTIYRGVALTPQ